jgi:hypothetical protein
MPIQYAVPIGPAQCAPPGIEFLVNAAGLKDVDVLGEVKIQRGSEPF